MIQPWPALVEIHESQSYREGYAGGFVGGADQSEQDLFESRLLVDDRPS